MTGTRLTMLALALTGVLVALLAATPTVARADDRGEGGRGGGHGRGGAGWGGHNWGGWRGPGTRLGFFYGSPYGFYDPWYYGYPYDYGWPYAYSSRRESPSRGCQAAYDTGLYDALSGRPQHYVKGETPGYRGKCRSAYEAGYAKGLVEQARKGEPDRYSPPKHYAAPSEGPQPEQ